MAANSVRTIFYALGANLAIAAAKTGAAVYTGSSAMLAEAIHSYADAGNQGLLLWGLKQAKRPPSPDYPLGWGKAVFFWSSPACRRSTRSAAEGACGAGSARAGRASWW